MNGLGYRALLKLPPPTPCFSLRVRLPIRQRGILSVIVRFFFVEKFGRLEKKLAKS